jgi:LPS O-antigen subunit length determinant protein (WzzB/FepE family)
MAEHMHKKYIAKVEKTLYTIETLEFIAETEKEAEDMLDDYCAGEMDDTVKVTETEIQEEEISGQWIEESEALSVDEFMEIDGGQSAYRD